MTPAPCSLSSTPKSSCLWGSGLRDQHLALVSRVATSHLGAFTSMPYAVKLGSRLAGFRKDADRFVRSIALNARHTMFLHVQKNRRWEPLLAGARPASSSSSGQGQREFAIMQDEDMAALQKRKGDIVFGRRSSGS